jgi:hypothetical protein
MSAISNGAMGASGAAAPGAATCAASTRSWCSPATVGEGASCAETRQVAASILTLLGQDWKAFDAGAGQPFAFIAPRR